MTHFLWSCHIFDSTFHTAAYYTQSYRHNMYRVSAKVWNHGVKNMRILTNLLTWIWWTIVINAIIDPWSLAYQISWVKWPIHGVPEAQKRNNSNPDYVLELRTRCTGNPKKGSLLLKRNDIIKISWLSKTILCIYECVHVWFSMWFSINFQIIHPTLHVI